MPSAPMTPREFLNPPATILPGLVYGWAGPASDRGAPTELPTVLSATGEHATLFRLDDDNDAQASFYPSCAGGLELLDFPMRRGECRDRASRVLYDTAWCSHCRTFTQPASMVLGQKCRDDGGCLVPPRRLDCRWQLDQGLRRVDAGRSWRITEVSSWLSAALLTASLRLAEAGEGRVEGLLSPWARCVATPRDRRTYLLPFGGHHSHHHAVAVHARGWSRYDIWGLVAATGPGAHTPADASALGERLALLGEDGQSVTVPLPAGGRLVVRPEDCRV